MEVKRIFDLLENYTENFPNQQVALASKVNGKWRKISIREYVERTNNYSYAMLALGIKAGDRVAIVCGSIPEWNMIDMAVMQIGAISVPIYSTISQEDYEHILLHSEVKMLVFDSNIVWQRIETIVPNISTLEHIFTVDALKHGHKTLDDLEKSGKENARPEKLKEIKNAINEHDLASIIYTSGTTGKQKGVMMSHANIINNVKNVQEIVSDWSTTALSFLPLCHAYERMLVYLYQFRGMSVYYAESLATIAADIKEINPTMMCCVPRLLEKIYDKLYLSGKTLKFPARQLYYWAFSVANKYKIENRNIFQNMAHKIADTLIYKKWRAALGGNFDIVVSGGSALQAQMASFFSAIGMPVFEGYGLTETSPVIAVNRRGAGNRKAGTVGLPLPNTEVKIAENGEVICRGHNVMLGYYKDPKLTAESIDKDGWFHTGDLGQFDGKLLKITGRLKNLFKTSFGKYVNPEVIETKFAESPFIEHIVVFGENKQFAAALIIPEFENLKLWCKNRGIKFTTKEEIIKRPEIIAHYQEITKEYNQHFGNYEQIKKFRLIADEWSPANFLSQTLKVKRGVVAKHYAEEIENLFK